MIVFAFVIEFKNKIVVHKFEKYNQYNLVYEHKSLNNDMIVKLKNFGYKKFYSDILKLKKTFFIDINYNSNELIDNCPEIDNDIKNLEGVNEVIIDSGWIKKLRSILYLIKVALVVLGVLLATVLIVVIGNTIRLQTLTYQNEIELSKLIGATDSFIHRPFIYTGIFYGLGGSLVNAGLLTVIIEIFNRIAYKFEYILGGLIVLYNLSLNEYLLLAAISMIIGLFASYYAASQSLKKIEKNF